MRQPSGLRATALVALCAVELVSLATIIVAAATAPLVPDTAEPEPLAGPDRDRQPQALTGTGAHRLAQ